MGIILAGVCAEGACVGRIRREEDGDSYWGGRVQLPDSILDETQHQLSGGLDDIEGGMLQDSSIPILSLHHTSCAMMMKL